MPVIQNVHKPVTFIVILQPQVEFIIEPPTAPSKCVVPVGFRPEALVFSSIFVLPVVVDHNPNCFVARAWKKYGIGNRRDCNRLQPTTEAMQKTV